MSSSSRPLLHVLVIGSSACPPDSNGQLPEVTNILSFTDINRCYFYFIDPRHYDVERDAKMFASYRDEDIPFCVVARNFNFETFSKEYKIEEKDRALFVDYAAIASSEYEFVSKLGNKKNWYYCTPGCGGKQLDLHEVYNKAKNNPHYTIYMDVPVPKGLSRAYRDDIKKEFNLFLQYVRYIPATSDDPDPPQWFVQRIGDDRKSWTMLRESAYQTLSHFFEVNGMSSYNCYPAENWHKLVSQVLGT